MWRSYPLVWKRPLVAGKLALPRGNDGSWAVEGDCTWSRRGPVDSVHASSPRGDRAAAPKPVDLAAILEAGPILRPALASYSDEERAELFSIFRHRGPLEPPREVAEAIWRPS